MPNKCQEILGQYQKLPEKDRKNLVCFVKSLPYILFGVLAVFIGKYHFDVMQKKETKRVLIDVIRKLSTIDPILSKYADDFSFGEGRRTVGNSNVTFLNRLIESTSKDGHSIGPTQANYFRNEYNDVYAGVVEISAVWYNGLLRKVAADPNFDKVTLHADDLDITDLKESVERIVTADQEIDKKKAKIADATVEARRFTMQNFDSATTFTRPDSDVAKSDPVVKEAEMEAEVAAKDSLIQYARQYGLDRWRSPLPNAPKKSYTNKELVEAESQGEQDGRTELDIQTKNQTSMIGRTLTTYQLALKLDQVGTMYNIKVQKGDFITERLTWINTSVGNRLTPIQKDGLTLSLGALYDSSASIIKQLNDMADAVDKKLPSTPETSHQLLKNLTGLNTVLSASEADLKAKCDTIAREQPAGQTVSPPVNFWENLWKNVQSAATIDGVISLCSKFWSWIRGLVGVAGAVLP